MKQQQTIRFQTAKPKDSIFRKSRDHVAYSIRSYSNRKDTYSKRDSVDAASMLLKLGICIAACMLVLLINSRQTADMYALANNETPQPTPEELPGQLRFVELPGLLSVFAPDSKPELPISCKSYEFQNKNTILCLSADEDQSVFSLDACTVDELGKSSEFGGFVRLKSEDTEWIVSGISDISVEKGQSLSARDTLGKVKNGEKLYLQVNISGEAIDLKSYFSLSESL